MRGLEALDLVVVIDVAMTETARPADTPPASSQLEKWRRPSSRSSSRTTS
jgi:anaerobic selenocysteine-containing dehydrogenase